MTETRCGFCGKGPFPSVSGLKKHIQQSKNCCDNSRKEFGRYLANVWHAPPSTSYPTESVDAENFEGEMDPAGMGTDVEEAIPRPMSHRPTVEDLLDEDEPDSSIRDVFVEPFPSEFKAGAAWGIDTPKFDAIHQAQDVRGQGTWGPFEDEDEWKLAEWLIKNVGQKQTDEFLKLPIVSIP